MKRKNLLLVAGGATIFAFALTLTPSVAEGAFSAAGCNHSGNHYTGTPATCGSAGNKEFWACCSCHEKFLTNPGKGTWVDQGAYKGPALESTHIAYLAPLSHTPGAWQVVEGASTLGVNQLCGSCQTPIYDVPQNEVPKPIVSTATWEVDPLSTVAPAWVNADKDAYHLENSGQTSKSYASAFKLTVKTAGTIAFEVDIWCEVGYDFLAVFKNSTVVDWKRSDVTGGNPVYTTKGKGKKTGYHEDVSLDVQAGDTLTFVKTADGSGWGSKDGVTYDGADVKLIGSYTKGLVHFDTQGAGEVVPVVSVDGCVTKLPAEPTKSGYAFDGWYKSASCAKGEEVVVGTYVGDNATVYAKWFDLTQSHVLQGTYKGFAFKNKYYEYPGSVPSFTASKNVTVDFHGSLSVTTASETVAGTLGALVNGETTLEGSNRKVKELKEGVLLIEGSSSQYSYILIKDSPFDYTSSNVTGTAFGSTGASGILVDFPDVAGVKQTVYLDGATGAAHYGVSVVPLSGSTIALSDVARPSSNIGFEIFDAKATKLDTWGYGKQVPGDYGNDTVFGKVTSPLYGAYTNSVAGDAEEKIYVSGNGRFERVVSGVKQSSATYEELAGNTLYYASGNDAVSYKLNLDTKTFESSRPTITVTYDLGGVAATLEKPRSAKYEVVGTTQKFAKASSASSGAWLWLSDLATVAGDKSTDGAHAFLGWYTDPACLTPVKQFHPTADFTLYAKWAKAYSVTVVKNNGEANEVLSHKEGDTPTLATPTNDGHLFGGWYTDPTFSTPYVPGALTSDVTVYAKWEAKPAFALGTEYVGYNGMYSSSNKNTSKTPNSTYSAHFNGDGTFTKGTSTTKYGTYDASSKVVDGILTLNNSTPAKLALDQANDGRYFLAMPDSGPGKDPVTGDIAFDVQLLEAGETASFVETVILNREATLVKTTITKADGTKKDYVCYVDATLDRIYADVTVETSNGVGFDKVYVGSSYATLITIKKGSAVVATWGGNGTTNSRNDGIAGSYQGSLNGKVKTITLDGFGKVTTSDGLTGTYKKLSGDGIELVFGASKSQVTLLPNTGMFKQILDGLQGTYNGAEGTLSVTGWGEATLNGVTFTYTKGGANVITRYDGGSITHYTLDSVAGTYTAATDSIFSGRKFSYVDWETGFSWYLTFEQGPEIKGTARVECGWNATGSATFTGVYDAVNHVLAITYTSDYSSSVASTGKTVTFAVSSSGLSCTKDGLGGNYSFLPSGTLTSSGFNPGY